MSDDFKLGDAAPGAGMGNLGPAPNAPKRGRKKRSDAGQQRIEGTPRRRLPRTDPKQVYELVGFPIFLGDQAGQLVSKFWRENSLSGTEIGELTVALGDEAMSHKALLKYLQSLSANAVHIRLAMVLTKIALPRMAKAGMLPEDIANAFVATSSAAERSATNAAESARDDSPAVPNGTGGTREFYGPDGERQVNGARSDSEPSATESWERAAPETVQDVAPVEAG